MGKREGRHRKRRAIPYGLTVVVLCTVCVVCFALPSVHEAHVRQIPRPTAALLSALEQGDEQLALHLLNDFNRSGSSFPQHRSRRRDCTPLMLAAGAAGRCWPRLVERILDFGLGIQAADVAAVSRSGRSAADYAELAGEGDLGARLRKLAERELKETAKQRCPCCGAPVGRRPRIASLADRYRAGQHQNPLLQEFFRKNATWASLMRPEFHTFHKSRSFHKELSESLCILAEIEKACPSVLHDNWHLIDLCCGKSLTSAIVSSQAPNLSISAVDYVSPDGIPHYAAAGIRTVSYLQQDLLDNGALQVLRERIDEVGYPTIVVGLHLCGNLSVFAVELFERLDTLRTCILVPCCLPHLRDAPNTLKHLYRRSVPDEQQYMEWASYLEARLAAIPKVTVSKTFAPHMKSKKRLILTAMKHHES